MCEIRLPDSLANLDSDQGSASLELYSPFEIPASRWATPRCRSKPTSRRRGAYVLNQSFVWQVERLQVFPPVDDYGARFLVAALSARRVPVVFVHGTFSSPVWWAEMVTTLNADPVLRARYQIWQFLYRSSSPVAISAAELRQELSATIQKLDPGGQDAALRQMVVIGHSQGGLLAKMTAIDTGDQLWSVLSKKPLAESNYTEAEREQIRSYLFLKPLPFVRRVVFICTPHRGS